MKTRKSINILFIFVVLCLLVITACSKTKEADKIETPSIVNDNVQKEVPKAWEMNMSTYDVNVLYQVPEFTPNVGKYEINSDLSSLFNAGQYTGFTQAQMDSISEDGFVALMPSYDVLKMHHIYEFPMYKESPVFITVDSALHLYHLYYDNSLKLVEASTMYEKLENMSFNIFFESIETYKNIKYEDLNEELKFISAYFLTACKLMDIDIQSIDVPEEITTLADEEMKLIEDSSDYSKSPILKKDLDYSQFVVRGHYTGDEKLEKYFKTMMWYGLSGFPVFDETKTEPTLDIDSLTKSMIITCLTLKDEKNFTAHENIYSTTALYAGMSDDLGIFEFKDLITNVYGQNPDLNIFKDSTYYGRLLEEALLLPEPKIQPKLTLVSTSVGRQFRFMGQRYSFDAEVLQNLMEPIMRPVPSGLDVIASFGSLRAEKLLDTYYKPKEKWDKYEENLNEMRGKQEEITDNEWMSDLYKGWLWSIKSSAVSFEEMEGMPTFMRSEKWTDKNIHTALGSYAELKHDSILYMKQAAAEMGGGGDINIPYNYVEPNVEVYCKLKWLAQNTKEHLKVRNMLDEPTSNVLDSIIEMQDTLMNVSVKELTNQNITEDENNLLYTYGGRIDNIIQIIYSMLYEKNLNASNDYTTALIADIATIAPNSFFPKGTYLEIGNGLPCEIYLVCNTNGKTYLAKGALFNYYEFLSDKRLTDANWHNLIGIRKAAIVYDNEIGRYREAGTYDENGVLSVEEGVDYIEEVQIGEPSLHMVSKPEWTNSFISTEENNVMVTNNIELDWSK
ncbi:MAG: DUF3160 domain-containing protein [Sedimentibacter sp.]